MAYCGKAKDILKACDATNINLQSGAVAVRHEALKITKDTVNPYLLTKVEVVDPATGAYPLPTSAYYPIKMEWLANTVQPNYEVVEGTAMPDRYKQTLGKLIIGDSETAEGKANIKALNGNLWAVVGKMKGAESPDDAFHVFGNANGLKFLPEATSAEFGNRVVGTFQSTEGGEESTPNGVNWLDTDVATTEALYNNRLEVVGG